MSDIDHAYNWDTPAQIQENQYNLMPAGTIVEFEVKKIDKKINQKLDCPAMDITLLCKNENFGTTFVSENISLHSKAKYFINAFFSSIGLLGTKKTFGELVNEAIGRKGKAKLKQDSWTGRDGTEYFSNKIDKYLKCEQPAAAAPADDDDNNPF